MSRALVSMRFCGGSKNGCQARTKWASDHQLYTNGRSMYSGARNEKRRNEPRRWLLFNTLIPSCNWRYTTFLRLKKTNRTVKKLKQPQLVEGNDGFCLTLERSSSWFTGFLGYKDGRPFSPGFPREEGYSTGKGRLDLQPSVVTTSWDHRITYPEKYSQVCWFVYGTKKIHKKS